MIEEADFTSNNTDTGRKTAHLPYFKMPATMFSEHLDNKTYLVSLFIDFSEGFRKQESQYVDAETSWNAGKKKYLGWLTI